MGKHIPVAQFHVKVNEQLLEKFHVQKSEVSRDKPATDSLLHLILL
jgi:hypothetical protein